MHGVNDSSIKTPRSHCIPLPKGLTKEQRDWLKHEHSEALLGSIVYQLMSDPNSYGFHLCIINSNALEIDDALYLQEETAATVEPETNDYSDMDDDDLDNFDWSQVTKSEPNTCCRRN